MKLKHTPGPWKVKFEYNIFDENNRLIASCGSHSNNNDVENTHNENIANSNLIQCAPEMLNELIKVFDTLYNVQPECYWLPIKNIIEKATGINIVEEILKEKNNGSH